MKHKRPNYFFLLLTLLITGCTVYHSPVTMPSLIKERGEIQANASFSCIPYGVYVNAGYGITNFISAHLSGCYILSGTFHFDGSTGLYKNFNKFNIGIFGGYVYGQGGFDEFNGFMGQDYSWFGNYQIPYGKFQLIYAPVKKFCFGTIVKVGDFNMSYNKYYNDNETGSSMFSDYIFINRESLLVEPSLFCIIRFTEKVGLTFSYTNSWFNKIKDPDIYSTVGESRFGLGNLGIGVVLKFGTKREKD
jgi:hypothetical protein